MPPPKTRNVFINCPFTPDYAEHFRAIVFSVCRSGYSPRCDREEDDGSQNRLEKIYEIIKDCPYGIHDISFTDLDPASGLPRFNMPLELGIFLGAKRYGGRVHQSKKALILDKEPFRYQQFLSDISGHDIHAHRGLTEGAITAVSRWLRDDSDNPGVPGETIVLNDYNAFSGRLPELSAAQQLDPGELTFKDYRRLASYWIAETQVNAAS